MHEVWQVTRPTLLLSIQREHADAILDGSKTYELRRVRPGIRAGDRILLYVTAPVSALCGYFRVDEIITGSPTHIWRRVQSGAGITRRQVYEYLRDARTPCAIGVGDAFRLTTSLSADEIRQAWAEFHPPRSFRYVPPDVMVALGLDNGRKAH